MNYRTPGVYVEEISTFPASVVPVETAIPVFIGYTDIAQKLTANDLNNVPTRISSILEYEQFFGYGPSMTVNSVTINENNALVNADMSRSYYLYDSLRLFYNNGGGDCYVMSIGLYSQQRNDQSDYTSALTTLEKVDEPTLIVFPDAIGLGTNLYEVQKAALAHCAKLQDRFCVMDLIESRAGDDTINWQTGYEEFRNNIGVNDLKYGAAYTPHLVSNLGVMLNYRDIQGTVRRGGVTLDLTNLTDDSDAQEVLTNLRRAITDNETISASITGLLDTQSSIRQEFHQRVDTFRGTNDTANFRAILNYLYDIVLATDAWLLPDTANTTPLTHTDLQTDLTNLINDSLLNTVRNIVAFDKGAEDSPLTGNWNVFASLNPQPHASAVWGDTFSANANEGPTANTAPFSGANDNERRSNALPTLLALFEQLHAAFNSIVLSGLEYEVKGEKALYDSHSVYRSLITELRNSTTILPPSGAMVGIYAKVDNDRGVFKAPANVSLNSVAGLTHSIDQNEQDQLNVHPVSGKSINAIRAFTGKGILVWGARTLAGNDNEWRYINVRRFFIFAEESIKKATEPFVFEPNDANTWTKIKAMITNFLTIQWRAGALAGAKPKHAFFVKVGLGETMTAFDILEGRMIVEIGMAVVRPAEFIILRFSHKMQES